MLAVSTVVLLCYCHLSRYCRCSGLDKGRDALGRFQELELVGVALEALFAERREQGVVATHCISIERSFFDKGPRMLYEEDLVTTL